MHRNLVILFLATTGSSVCVLASCAGQDGGPGSAGSGGVVFGGGTGGSATGGGGAGGGPGGSGGMGGGGMGGTVAGGGMGGTVAGGGMGGGGMGGTGGTICKTPTTLHPPKGDAGTDSIYCPFSSPDGGKNLYCAAGSEHCCEPTATGSVSTCNPIATPCAGTDTDWQCQDPVADCPSGQKCCGTGSVVKNSDPNCANYASGFKGTRCAASCGTGEVEMCTADSECTAPKTCLPFGTKGAQVGACY